MVEITKNGVFVQALFIRIKCLTHNTPTSYVPVDCLAIFAVCIIDDEKLNKWAPHFSMQKNSCQVIYLFNVPLTQINCNPLKVLDYFQYPPEGSKVLNTLFRAGFGLTVRYARRANAPYLATLRYQVTPRWYYHPEV